MNDGPILLIVFGASGNVGRAVLACATLGDMNVIATHHSDSGKQLLKRCCETCGRSHVDVAHVEAAQSKSIKDVFNLALRRNPTTTYIVNCIGFNAGKSMEAFSDQDAIRVLEANLLSNLFILREVSKAANGLNVKSVVLLGSSAAVRASALSPPYVASKAGLGQLVAIYAKHLAPDVRINCVAPGIILDEYDAGRCRVAKESAIPLARYATAQEVAEVIEFLLVRCPYITGQTVVVDGGLVL